jgi:hypothetical protein
MEADKRVFYTSTKNLCARYIWSVSKCKILKIFECHENKADLVSFNIDENYFYSFGIDQEHDILEFFETTNTIKFINRTGNRL